MQPSMETLLDSIIDYAGLFPPARLPMEQAVANYVESQGPSRVSNWIVDKFVCPAAWLAELKPHIVPLYTEELPFDLSVLGQKAKRVEEILPTLAADLASLADFTDEFADTRYVRCIELPLPEAGFADRKSFEDLLHQIRDMILAAPAYCDNACQIFIEWPYTSEWKTQADFVVKVLRDVTGPATIDWETGAVFGLKLRTGGLEAAAFPPSEFLAVAMKECHQSEIHWKATAGLHHPFRHFDQHLATLMHGFLNVAVADAIGLTYPDIEVATLVDILEEQNEVRFQFSKNSIRWKDLRIHINELADARWKSFGSFGSCSIDEPIEHLKRFGLL